MDLGSEDSWASCSGSEMRKINWSLQFSSLGPTLCSLPPGFQPCPPRVPSLSVSLLAIFEVGVGKCALLWGCRAAQVFCQFRLGGPRSRTISPTPAVYRFWGYSRGEQRPTLSLPFQNYSLLWEPNIYQIMRQIEPNIGSAQCYETTT